MLNDLLSNWKKKKKNYWIRRTVESCREWRTCIDTSNEKRERIPVQILIRRLFGENPIRGSLTSQLDGMNSQHSVKSINLVFFIMKERDVKPSVLLTSVN